MTNHPNRNWQRQWSYDQETQTVTHADGWAFQFSAAPDVAGAFDGKLIAQPEDLSQYQPDIALTASKMAKQAGDFYAKSRTKLN